MNKYYDINHDHIINDNDNNNNNKIMILITEQITITYSMSSVSSCDNSADYCSLTTLLLRRLYL